MGTASNYGRHWFKSSFSRDTSSCVVVSLGWVKSSFSRDSSNCVVVRQDADTVLIRDDKYQGDPADEPIIAVPAAAWPEFLAVVAAEESLEGPLDGMPAIIREADGTTTLRDSRNQALSFTIGEWVAFTKGVQAGEFSPAAA
ncbi:DUF397 domain-containing protein [Nocardia thraciensis]